MIRRAILTLVLLALAAPANAQEREVPYWATLRSDEVNMRVGPGADYKIDWVYRRAGLPMKVVRLVEGWRLVEDPEGRADGSPRACSAPTAARSWSAKGSRPLHEGGRRQARRCCGKRSRASSGNARRMRRRLVPVRSRRPRGGWVRAERLSGRGRTDAR